MKLWGFEKRWLAVVFDTIIPSGANAQLPLGARDVPMDRYVDDLFRVSPTLVSFGFRVALWVVVWSPILFFRSFRRFVGLSPTKRVEWLQTMRGNRFYAIRELPVVLKMVACLGYCGLPEVQRQIGLESLDDEPPAWARGAEAKEVS